MKYLIDEAVNKIPPLNDGFTFIKRAIVCIPIKEVGVTILEKRQQRLSFIYETILRMISLGVTDLDLLSAKLGIERDIYSEIVAQMAKDDIIYVSQISIGLTMKGKQALSELSRVTISKSQINQIYINLITGELYSGEHNDLIDKPPRGNMCLDYEYDPDISFLREKFEMISKIYIQNSISNTFSNSQYDENSLYRILDVAYNKIRFQQKACFVYINDDNLSLLLSFENDEDSQYMAIALKQIGKNLNGASKLFDNYINNCIPEETDAVRAKSLEKFTSLVDPRSRIKHSPKEIEEAYYSDRYLLDGEVNDLLLRCCDFRPMQVTICSSSLKKYLEDNRIINALTNAQSNEVIIIYDPTEKDIDNSLIWLQKIFSENNQKCLKVVPMHDVSYDAHTRITMKPGFTIEISYETFKDDQGHMLIKELAEISFEEQKIEKALSLVTQYLQPL